MRLTEIKKISEKDKFSVDKRISLDYNANEKENMVSEIDGGAVDYKYFPPDCQADKGKKRATAEAKGICL